MLDFRAQNTFRHSFVDLKKVHHKYLDIFEYFNKYRQYYIISIYYLLTNLFIRQILIRFLGHKYIQIFIRQRKITFATHWYQGLTEGGKSVESHDL